MEIVLNALAVLARRRKLVAGVFLLVALGGLAGAYLNRQTFESSAKLLINFESRGVSLSRADVQQGTTVVQAVEEITSQVEILRSRELIERLIDKVGEDFFAEPPPANPILRLAVNAIGGTIDRLAAALQAVRLVEPVAPRNQLVESLERALQVYPVRQAQIIVVAFRWRNPRVPPALLWAMLDLYLAKVADINAQSDAYDLFVEQTRRANQDLESAERELRRLEVQYDVTDLRREKQLLVERVERLTTLTEGATSAASDAPPGRPVATPRPSDQEATIVGAQIAQLRAQLNGLRIERAKALISFTADHRQIRELDNQIATIEAALASETRLLAATLDAYKARIRTLQAAESEFNRATRNIEIATEAYQTYRKVAEDRRVKKAQETRVKVQIVDPPTTPFRPVGASRLLIAIGAIFFALVFAIGLTLLINMIAVARANIRAAQDGKQAARAEADGSKSAPELTRVA